jgi:hypothetical protein
MLEIAALSSKPALTHYSHSDRISYGIQVAGGVGQVCTDVNFRFGLIA